MEDPISTFEAAGFTVEIYPDNECPSPREDGTLGTIVAWHPRYNLGEPHTFATPADFHASLLEEKPAVLLPVYLFDHSGLALSTRDFGDPWDSGQVGYIYATAAAIRAAFAVTRITAAVRRRAEAALAAEVAEYGAYVNGECYGYVICDAAGAEVGACWGFIGLEHAEAAARSVATELARTTERLTV